METIDINQLINMAPAVAVLIYLHVQQQRQINRLLSILARCCDDSDDKTVTAILDNQ
jgi:hypothetical protein